MGAINLYLGDCMEAMVEMKENEYDLAIVDPPYGIGMDNQVVRVKPNRRNTWGRGGEKKYKESNWDSNSPTFAYFKHLYSVSENQIIWGANYFCDLIRPAFGWIYWDKQMGENNFSSGELAFKSFGVSMDCFSHPSMRVAGTRIHPTQKPVKLYEWLLMNYAKPGQKILDTHGGSMSIALAVHNVNEREGMNLSLDLWEIDEEYYNAGVARYENHIRQKTIFS